MPTNPTPETLAQRLEAPVRLKRNNSYDPEWGATLEDTVSVPVSEYRRLLAERAEAAAALRAPEHNYPPPSIAGGSADLTGAPREAPPKLTPEQLARLRAPEEVRALEHLAVWRMNDDRWTIRWIDGDFCMGPFVGEPAARQALKTLRALTASPPPEREPDGHGPHGCLCRTLRDRLVGDGCEICNPEYMADD